MTTLQVLEKMDEVLTWNNQAGLAFLYLVGTGMWSDKYSFPPSLMIMNEDVATQTYRDLQPEIDQWRLNQLHRQDYAVAMFLHTSSTYPDELKKMMKHKHDTAQEESGDGYVEVIAEYYDFVMEKGDDLDREAINDIVKQIRLEYPELKEDRPIFR